MTEKKRKSAGGRATEAGMSFQAGVGTWVAAHLAAAEAIGRRFGRADAAVPVRVQFETNKFLDDIAVTFADGSSALIQCKTHPTMSASENGDLGNTIAQLVSLYLSWKEDDLAKTSAILAVAEDAARSLDKLETACRFFDAGGTWADSEAALSAEKKAALVLFANHAKRAWRKIKKSSPENEDLVALARLFRIIRFDVNHDGRDIAEASRLLGETLLGNSTQGPSVLSIIAIIVRGLTKSGAPADRQGLLKLIRNAGIQDVRSPGYDSDIARLKSMTAQEIMRLTPHSKLSSLDQVSIPRECETDLGRAIHDGSLLIVGEPGAGKTGVLVEVARTLLMENLPLVFLSVDRLEGVATLDDMRLELGLRLPILEVLENWPGSEPCTLIIDALDASRGGASEGAFCRLIEDGLNCLGRKWSIVASIRTFDLQNGKRFQRLFQGSPPEGAYSHDNLSNTRHFLVRQLTDGEIEAGTKLLPELGKLLEHAPSSVREILRNVFNLSLAAKLLSSGILPQSIATITTQAELIAQYEDERLSELRLKRAVASALMVMVSQRKITVRVTDVPNDSIEDVLATGLMTSAGDRISFAHHVLFDHAASRFHLVSDDAERLASQLSSDPAIGFLLGPALKFTMDQIWAQDDVNRVTTWSMVAALSMIDEIDPIVVSIALRTATEGVVGREDIVGLTQLLSENSSEQLARLLHRVARFVRLRAKSSGTIPTPVASAWATVADAAIATNQTTFALGARFLLWTLSDYADVDAGELAPIYGRAARNLLALAWENKVQVPGLTTQAIRSVARSFATDPQESRTLLNCILEEPRFSENAHEEAPWLAEGIKWIWPTDPEFVCQIYTTIFGQHVKDGKSWLGGQPSQILPLSSNRRQDYEHGRWHLKEVFTDFLMANPYWGTRAASASSIGKARDTGKSVPELTKLSLNDGSNVHIFEDRQTLQDWRTERHPDDAKLILKDLASFLEQCEPQHFETVVKASVAETTSSSVWARIFGVGAERTDIAGDLLWPIAINTDLLGLVDVVRDAIFFLAAAYPTRSADERKQFETILLKWLNDRNELRDSRLSPVGKFFRLVEVEFETPELNALKHSLADQNRLEENRPYMTMTISHGNDAGDIVDAMLEDEGADLSKGPDKAVRDPSRELSNLIREWPSEPSNEEIKRIWSAVQRLLVTMDEAEAIDAAEEVKHAAWGAIGEAVAKIASSDAYDPTDGRGPKLNELVSLVDRLAASQYPEGRGTEDDSSLSWGNWDVRVYAANAVMDLTRRFSKMSPTLPERLDNFADDPVAAVRLQIAQSLNTIWHIDNQKMWLLFEKFATSENNTSILGSLISGPLARASEKEPGRVETLIEQILKRLPPTNNEAEKNKREPAAEAIASLAARLWLGRGRPTAKSWIEKWRIDLEQGEPYLWQLVSHMRGALFLAYGQADEPIKKEIQDRTRVLAFELASTTSRWMKENRAVFEQDALDETWRASAKNRYRIADQTLDHLANQFYFGSGAHSRDKGDPPGLSGSTSKKQFLSDYADTLNLIGNVATPHTLHHLIELYEFLADGAPHTVFDEVARLIVGVGAREGYQFESMGADALVRIVRRYLADFRPIFDDVERRTQLVDILELFSEAGWPDALNLLYDLPDLFR